MFFYYQRFRRCDSVAGCFHAAPRVARFRMKTAALSGFAVFMIASGIAGFVVALYLAPLSPLLRDGPTSSPSPMYIEVEGLTSEGPKEDRSVQNGQRRCLTSSV